MELVLKEGLLQGRAAPPGRNAAIGKTNLFARGTAAVLVTVGDTIRNDLYLENALLCLNGHAVVVGVFGPLELCANRARRNGLVNRYLVLEDRQLRLKLVDLLLCLLDLLLHCDD